MVERLRAQVRHAILGNILAYVAILLLVAGGLYWIDQRDVERQRELCGLIVLTDDSYRSHPASGQGGQAFARAVHDYRQRLGCDQVGRPTSSGTSK